MDEEMWDDKTVKEIIINLLKHNEFDGLYSPGECACKIDDLFPCCSDFKDCIPGYESIDTTGEYDYLIGPKKEPVEIITSVKPASHPAQAAPIEEPSC